MLHPQQQARWYPTAGSSFPLFCFLHILIALPRVTSQVSYLYPNPISDSTLGEPRTHPGRSLTQVVGEGLVTYTLILVITFQMLGDEADAL